MAYAIAEPGILLSGGTHSRDEMAKSVVRLAEVHGCTVEDLSWEGDEAETLDALVEAYGRVRSEIAYRAIAWLNKYVVAPSCYVSFAGFGGSDLVCVACEDDEDLA